MQLLPPRAHAALDRVERRVAPHLLPAGLHVVQYGIAVLFIWFGVAKLWSPGDGLELVAGVQMLFGLPGVFGMLLALWEVVIGAQFLSKQLVRYAAPQLLVHQAGTFLALVALPHLTWATFPWLTLHGQFVAKNVLIVGGALLVWHATLHTTRSRTDC